MSERSIETTGDTVEEAISKGLAELGVNPMQVVIEVLEEPSRGVFGLGARPARVLLKTLSTPQPPMPPPAPPVEEPPIILPDIDPEARIEPEEREAERRRERNEGRRRDDRAERPRTATAEYDVVEDEDADAASLFRDMDEIVPENELDEEAQVGQVVLNELLERMNIRGTIVIRRAKPSEEGEEVPYILDVTGGDLTRLIGRRGDTLASLQYIARLITSRELQRRANLIVDVNGYKARRAKMLHGLALRMADQAVERGRTVALEPMPPHERRIIHLALRERDDVTTRSVGEGSGRKVTIVPNNEA